MPMTLNSDRADPVEPPAPAYIPGSTFRSDMIGHQIELRGHMLDDDRLILVASGILRAYGELVDKVAFYVDGVREEVHFDPRKIYADITILD